MTLPPFNPVDFYPQINDALGQIFDIYRELEKAEAAGIDVKKLRQEFQFYEKHFSDLKSVYFPDKP